jgi:hypothetical protein
VTEVIESVKRIANALRDDADNQKKLKAIKGNEELLQRINEVMVEIDLQSSKIVAAIKINKNVLQDLTMLKEVMVEIQEFFVAVQKAFMFMSKTKLKLRMQNLYQSLRARLTQVMAAVSLALLTDKPIKEPTPKVSSEIYRAGLNYYYGIHGKPMNYTFAFEKFIQAAEYGDEDAMFFAAICYLKGHGVDDNYDTALHWLERASSTGRCPQAKTEIAKLIIEQIKKESESAIADSLHPTSQYQNVMKSPRTSRQSLRASISRFSVASGEGGEQQGTYRDEDGDEDYAEQDEQDIQYAMKLLLEAATEGHVEAKTVLGTVYEEAGDLEQGAKWYSLASNGGSAKGTYHLGQLFLQGNGSMMVNRHKAFSLFAMAAKNGQMEAWNGMGLCYESGVGIDQNVSLAVNYYRKGALMGHVQAMYNLGYVLVKNAIEILENMKKVKIIATHVHHIRYGDGGEEILEEELSPEQSEVYLDMGKKTERALEEGIHWLRAAAENKISDASFQLGRLYEQAIGVPLDKHAALAHYRRAADVGHAKAALYAANLLYARGGHAGDGGHNGFDRDLVEAAKYYGQSARVGIAEAMNAYALLLEDGRATEDGLKDSYAAATWYYEACLHDYTDAFLNLALMLATDPIHSFSTVNGEIVTLGQITKFLDNNLPLEMDRDKLDTFRSLIEQVYAKGQEPSHQHHVHGSHKRYANTGSTTATAPDGDNISLHSTGSGQGRIRGSAESKYEAGGSLVLVDPNGGDVYQAGINEITCVPSLQRARRSKHSTFTADNQSVNSSAAPTSLPGTLAAERASRLATRDSLPPKSKSQNQSGIQYDDSYDNGRPVNTRAASINMSMGSKRVIFDTTTSKSLSALSAISTGDEYSHHLSTSASVPQQQSLHRAGEMFVTNGAIPPPNYVPRATMAPPPSSASKPIPAKVKTPQTSLSSSAFPAHFNPQQHQHMQDLLQSAPLYSQSPIITHNKSHNYSHNNTSASSPGRLQDPSAALKNRTRDTATDYSNHHEHYPNNQHEQSIEIQRQASNSSVASTGSATAKSTGEIPKKTGSMWQKLMRGSKNISRDPSPGPTDPSQLVHRGSSAVGVSTSVPSLK